MNKDYKKLYKQALERAKYLKENTDSVGAKDISYTFEYIFPELRESEDERIRKAILHLVQHSGIATYDGINWLDMVSWLEKQGGQKSTWSEEDEKMKSLIINTLTSMGTLNLERYYHMNLDEVKNWLKSFKSNHWKPSEEQMEALKKRTHGLHTSSETRKALESLINDLLKL